MDKTALKEPVRHGTEPFPFQVYPGFLNPHKILNPPGGFYSHWHEEMEMIWVGEATGTLTVDGDALEVKPRTVFFIHPGEIHSWQPRGKKQGRVAAVVFHWRLLDLFGGSVRENYLQPLAQGRLKLPRMLNAESGWKLEVFENLEILVDVALAHKTGSELAILARLYTILSKLAMSGAIKPSDPRTSDRSSLKVDRIKKALQYIMDHHAVKITVAELAGAAGLSSFHFCRQFKNVTNQTPVGYLNRFRVERAAELLKDPNRKVLEASLDVGFTHLSYFIKTFKRFQNCTPSEFRAAHKADNPEKPGKKTRGKDSLEAPS
jgi:AraC-like DNA-binding protein